MPLKKHPKPRGPQYSKQSERGSESQYQYDELQAEGEYSNEDVSDQTPVPSSK